MVWIQAGQNGRALKGKNKEDRRFEELLGRLEDFLEAWIFLKEILKVVGNEKWGGSGVWPLIE